MIHIAMIDNVSRRITDESTPTWRVHTSRSSYKSNASEDDAANTRQPSSARRLRHRLPSARGDLISAGRAVCNPSASGCQLLPPPGRIRLAGRKSAASSYEHRCRRRVRMQLGGPASTRHDQAAPSFAATDQLQQDVVAEHVGGTCGTRPHAVQRDHPYRNAAAAVSVNRGASTLRSPTARPPRRRTAASSSSHHGVPL